MSLVIKVNNIDRTKDIEWSTLQYSSIITKEVDRLQFFVKKTATKTLPTLGQEVELLEDAITLFGGIVIEKNEESLGGLLVGYTIVCKDFSATLDGMLVVRTYTNAYAGDIVKDIIDTYTTGFTYANVPAVTPLIPTIKFNYEQVSRSFAKICDAIGWDWYVDADKDIHLFDTESNAAPFNITDSNGMADINSATVNSNIVNLKNSIFVRGGERKKTLSASDTYDKYTADGSRTTFQLAYKYDNIQVEDNGVAKTVGIDNIDNPTGFDCLYNFQEKFVKFTAAPTNTHTIKIFGDAFIPILVQVTDDASISTYGEFQDIVINKNITSVEEAQQRALIELEKYAGEYFEASFQTTETGLRVGQTINVNSTTLGINKDFKINRIEGRPDTSSRLIYTVYLIVSGEITFTDVMLMLLLKDRNNLDISDNEVLQAFISAPDETITIVDAAPVVTSTSPPYTWGSDADELSWSLGTWS